FEIDTPAGRSGLIRRAGHVQQRDQPAVAALPDFDVLLWVLFALNRREEDLLGYVIALPDARAITVRQTREKRLGEARDQVMLKRGPESLLLQIRVHSGEGAWHVGLLPFLPEISAVRAGGSGPSQISSQKIDSNGWRGREPEI